MNKLKASLLGLGAGLASGIGLPRFLHARVYRKQLSILMYHAVVPRPLQVPDWCFLDEASFREQISYVKEHFCVLPLDEAVDLLKRDGLKVPTLAITFDDGYQNNYEVAFPVLAQYDCPATIFLSTRYIDSDQMPWFGRLNLALILTGKPSFSWEGARFDISSPERKSQTSAVLHQQLKTHHPYSIDGRVAGICQALEVDTDRKFEAGSPYHMLRTDAIRDMAKSGLVRFGAHTHNHAILSRLSRGEQKEEIAGSIKLVEKFTGETCDTFAYPNGTVDDYDQASIELVRSSGVTSALSTISGPNTSQTPLMELRRYGVGSDLDLPGFKSLAHHVTHQVRQFA
jgi:peptidoglycan/xylan/chitin deacetylase (PgdA/CDA1 family)